MQKSIFFFICYLCLIHNIEAQNARFTENKGQWDERIKYQLRTVAGNVLFENQQFTFALFDTPQDKHEKAVGDNSTEILKSHVYRSHFIGANSNYRIVAQNRYEDYGNYYLGNDKSKWKDHVYSYSELTYKDLYEGIDVHIYNENGNLKYDYLLSAAALQQGGISKIQVAYEGISTNDIHINEKGDLVFQTNVGKVTELKPFSYQVIDGKKKEIPSAYLWKNGVLSFSLQESEIDVNKPLVIDPTLVFSTFSGSTQDNWGFTSTYDNDGNGYGGGVIYSGYNTLQYQIGDTGYPVLGAYQTSYNGGAFDATITKFNAEGTALVYSTYLGGFYADQPHSMVVDASGNLFVLGRTGSGNFPTTANAFASMKSGNFDLFITKFSPTGALLSSTFLGGSDEDGVNGDTIEGIVGTPSVLEYNYGDDARGEIFADNTGNIYVAACTKSTNFPLVAASQSTYGGGNSDAVVCRLDNSLSSLLFSTYLGGSGEDAAYSINIDNAANIYVSGGTTSLNFPTTANALHSGYQGGIADGFVSKFSASNGWALEASTYIGTNKYDQSYFIQIHNNNAVYIVGQTNGSYPVIGNVYVNSEANQFISKLDMNLSSLLLSTTFGTDSAALPNISPTAFLVDDLGRIYVAGWGGTLGSYNPGCTHTFGMNVTANAYQSTTDGSDVYLMVLSPNMANLEYATFFGGNTLQEHVDGGTCRYSPSGVVYHVVCAGCGGSSAFPTTPSAWSETNNSNNCNLALFKMDFNVNQPNTGFTASAAYHTTTAKISPNPVNVAEYALSFDLKERKEVLIQLYDNMGRMVKTLYEGSVDAGDNTFHFEKNQLQTGAYHLLILSEQQVIANETLLIAE